MGRASFRLGYNMWSQRMKKSSRILMNALCSLGFCTLWGNTIVSFTEQTSGDKLEFHFGKSNSSVVRMSSKVEQRLTRLNEGFLASDIGNTPTAQFSSKIIHGAVPDVPIFFESFLGQAFIRFKSKPVTGDNLVEYRNFESPHDEIVPEFLDGRLATNERGEWASLTLLGRRSVELKKLSFSTWKMTRSGKVPSEIVVLGIARPYSRKYVLDRIEEDAPALTLSDILPTGALVTDVSDPDDVIAFQYNDKDGTLAEQSRRKRAVIDKAGKQSGSPSWIVPTFAILAGLLVPAVVIYLRKRQ